jgi:uncharacterized protein
MNFDKILSFFVPKDVAFFPLFVADAKILIKGAELLNKLMQEPSIEGRMEITKELKAVEHEGDDMTHKIFQQLNKSFITPFDREDIQELASSIDDVLDFMNGTSQRISLYKPKTLIPVFKEMADLIMQASREIEQAVVALHVAGKNKDKIIQNCIALNEIENKGDDLYHLGIMHLFEDERDASELIKKKEILETLEKCIDKAEDVSDTIKTILIKMS